MQRRQVISGEVKETMTRSMSIRFWAPHRQVFSPLLLFSFSCFYQLGDLAPTT